MVVSVRMNNGELSKRSKYRNRRTICGAQHSHQSSKEANRCDELHLMVKGGLISELQLKKRYPIVIDGMKICDYEDDFNYVDNKTKTLIIEDCKGMKTRIYSLKKKLMLAVRGLTITES